MATFSPIPQPPTTPFVGNLPLLDLHLPIKSFKQLAQQYGEIYQFKLPSGDVVLHINSQPLLAQISNDKRFKKVVIGALSEVRNLVGDGLFTAHLEERNWGIAHRILMPAFSIGNVRKMFEGMKDICDQLLLKWERFGPDQEINPVDDFTRLTFDTISLCSMSYRFNSFYEKDLPKFVQLMGDVLKESSNRAFRTPFSKAVPFLNRTAEAKYFADIKEMVDMGTGIVKKRRANPVASKDVLTMMLEGRDPQTGEGLSDDVIVYNFLTFLIAGHETTSGLLSFATYYVLKNPNTLIKLRQEVDSVVGTEDICLEHLDKMPYLSAVMHESLRLSPSVIARRIAALEDTELIGGDGDASNPANKKYAIKKGASIVAHIHETQVDPRCWGEDAELFRPERMLNGKFDAMPPQAWQPFGFGLRACLGRLFAWQEAQLVLSSIVQKFDLALANPSYSLEIKQTLSQKPKDLRIRARLRTDSAIPSFSPLPSATAPAVAPAPDGTASKATATGGEPLYVFYGSNTGSSESFAGRLASDAAAHGFAAKIAILDSATGHLPADGPVVIVTASFEGEPADNAAQFVSWLESLPGEGSDGLLKGVNFAVFGCGNREWARTYQRIPTLIYQTLEKNGATRIMNRGEGDAASASFFQEFDGWEAKLWVALAEKYGGAKAISASAPSILADTFEVNVIDAGTGRAKMLRQQDAAMGTVFENRCLTREGVPEKRHIEIQLPDDMSYRAGDYLAILPTNPPEIVERVLAYFKLAGDKEIVIKTDGPTTLPSGYPVPCKELLGGYVELTQPATSRDISTLERFTESEATVSSLKALRDDFENAVLPKRINIIDILESHPDIHLPFSQLLRLLPPMRVRQYSISSSPLVNPGHVSLTISVLDAPALSGIGKRHLGIASNYLARLAPGDKVPVVVRPSAAAFHLPSDPRVPVIMTCAGSGLAPFRGFIQERAAQKAAGRDVGKTILFFGCRAPEDDYLYADTDLQTWTKEGVVGVRPAFSKKSEACHGCKYAQDRVWFDREEIIKLSREGAKFYTCGSRGLSNGVKKIYLDIVKHAHPELDDSAAAERLERIQKERFASDVFD